MRLAGPSPAGSPPDPAALSAALSAARGGRVLCGDRPVDVGSDRLHELAAHLGADASVPPFQLLYEVPIAVDVDLASGPARLEIAPDGSFRAASWSAFVAAAAPRAILAWLAAAGCPEPLARFDRACSPEGAREREAWIAAAPSAIRELAASLPERPLGGDDLTSATRRLERSAGGLLGLLPFGGHGRAAAVLALLRFWGRGAAITGEHPAYEDLPRWLLSPYGFADVLAVFPKLRDPAELRGAGRFLLAGPVSPSLLEQIEALPHAAREAIAAAVTASDPSAGRLVQSRLFPSSWAPPSGAALVGLSATPHLRRLVAEGERAFAIDGFELVRLEGGERTVVCPMPREAPIAAFSGHIYALFGGTVRKYTPEGHLVEALPAAPPGATALLPSDEQSQAFAAFAHVGCPPPDPATRIDEAHARALATSLGLDRAQIRQILPTGDSVLLVIEAGAGEAVIRVPRPS